MLVSAAAAASGLVATAAQAATDTHSPQGHMDALRAVPGGVTVAGWAFDPDVPTTALVIYLWTDGKLSGINANQSRPDVAALYPGIGPRHGFAATMRLPEGAHHLCAVAGNLSYGTGKTLACATLTVADSPRGQVDLLAQSSGGLSVSGWTFDPDSPTTPLAVDLIIDGQLSALRADKDRPDVAAIYPGVGPSHGFAATVRPAEGPHHVCAVAVNLGYGASKTLACATVTLRYTPTTALSAMTPTATGVRVTGWTTDPDTAAAILVRVSADGRQLAQLTAAGPGSPHPGHSFTLALTLKSGTHSICAAGVNVLFGTGSGPPACRSVTLRLNPFGQVDAVTRPPGSHNLLVDGWAIDADTSTPIKITVKVDAAAPVVATAGGSRPDVGQVYPQYGARHGYSVTVPASEGEHTVCISALNVSGGANSSLGCKVINAVHPVAPSAPRGVRAVVVYGGAVVSWTKPVSDGGAPVSGYTVTATPGGAHASVSGQTTIAGITGLAANTRYTFAVVATNVAGRSAAGSSPAVTTPAGPPPQTSPAPISTSRYVRNISDSATVDLAKMRAEGAADARANPPGHSYLILLDIGGQDEARHGVLLSATTRFVSYPNLVRDLEAYVDGYAGQQRAGAPVTIAIGTNNDMDVSLSSGASWARSVVSPVAAHAAAHSSMRVAGANDIEPGFRATYTQSRAWVSGYLGATKAPFVFNGSADGCAWTVTGAGCNNGWTMAGLYALSAGALPTRIINLPQIYNNTMAAQWKYISLTGVAKSQPRINFGGALTEFTACAQAGGCGSLTGNNAWIQMWQQLQSHPALRIASLPYSTDLRIDG